jgi:molybdopterin/thiamine biosynthesis adenylyltransferase/rhodanese-related sulfurtransferase
LKNRKFKKRHKPIAHHTMMARRVYDGRSTPSRVWFTAIVCLLTSQTLAFVVLQQRSAPTIQSHSPSTTTIILQSSNTANVVLSNDEIARYSRHLVLANVGVAGQVALKNSSVLVVGAGGLGSSCLLYLAAAGVGHIGIVDADTVDTSNLQRQVIHGTSTVGVNKGESAASRINDVNPNANVRVYQEELTSVTAKRIVGEGFEPGRPYDVVIDGSDNFPTKYLIKCVCAVFFLVSYNIDSLLRFWLCERASNRYISSPFLFSDVCSIFNIPWVYSAILAFEGQLSVFNFQNGPDYRDLLPTPPPPGDVPSCAEGGVLGVLPGTMGCLQATETLKVILGKTNGILSGRVLVFDAMAMKFSEMGLSKQIDREPITELIDYKGFCGGPQVKQQTTTLEPTTNNARTLDEVDEAIITVDTSFHSIEPHECMEKLVTGWSPFVLDVRLQTENDIVQLPFTDRVVPHRQVRASDVPKSGDVLVYCKAGVRGKKACVKLIEDGVDSGRLYNLEGGIMGWQKQVDASMPRY